jgi:hypothetical protein
LFIILTISLRYDFIKKQFVYLNNNSAIFHLAVLIFTFLHNVVTDSVTVFIYFKHFFLFEKSTFFEANWLLEIFPLTIKNLVCSVSSGQ